MSKPTTELLKKVPEGLVVSRSKLLEMGFDKPAIDYFLRSGKLVSLTRGVYRRPGPPLKWEHLVYSVRQHGYQAHVGTRSALDLSGFAHFLPLGGNNTTIHLYCQEKLPNWLATSGEKAKIHPHRFKLFRNVPQYAITEHQIGHWDWTIEYASPELALLELVDDIKDETDFTVADKYFEPATTLRPKVLNTLLSTCTMVQAKRLFLWFAKRHEHPWYAALNMSDIHLGSGKRMVIQGGSLDKDFQITVPKEMTARTTDGSQPNFF